MNFFAHLSALSAFPKKPLSEAGHKASWALVSLWSFLW